MSDRNRYDDAYDQGYLSGKNDDAMGSFAQTLVKGLHFGDVKATEAHNAGYEDGARDRRDDNNSHYRGKSREIRENWKRKEQIREEREYQSRLRQQAQQSQPFGSFEDFMLGLGAKVIGILIVIAAVGWFITAIILPLVIINVATIALLFGLCTEKSRKAMFFIAIVGAVFVVIDYNLGWMTKSLVDSVAFFKDVIPFLYAINLSAGLIASYFLLRDHLTIPLPERLAVLEPSKRKNLLIGSLMLIGLLTGGLQYYSDASSSYSGRSQSLGLIRAEQGNRNPGLTTNSSGSVVIEKPIQGSNPKRDFVPFYIVTVDVFKTASEAEKRATALEKQGNDADYLWIPDFASLSGAQLYLVYLGPYATQQGCEIATEEYRKVDKNAYGLLVSHEATRVQINGIGKVHKSQNDLSNNDAGSRFLGKWTKDESEIFSITKVGSTYHFESNMLFHGAKTEMDARLVNGELTGRASDDLTGRNTIISYDNGMLRVTNLYDNDLILHKAD